MSFKTLIRQAFSIIVHHTTHNYLFTMHDHITETASTCTSITSENLLYMSHMIEHKNQKHTSVVQQTCPIMAPILPGWWDCGPYRCPYRGPSNCLRYRRSSC